MPGPIEVNPPRVAGSTPDPTAAAADAALALQLLGHFFTMQIDAGAVEAPEIIAHINRAAEAVHDANPVLGPYARASARRMIDNLPTGWADRDPDWPEPA